jgi:hypothetical protein
MMNNQRNPITLWLSTDAIQRLREINNALLRNGGKPREVSPGKVVETLLRREDAHVYAENALLKE